MNQYSLLYLNENQKNYKESEEVLLDLGLDKIIQDICNRNRFFNLSDLYKTPVDLENVKFRQEIFRDLKVPEIFAVLSDFNEDMEELGRKERQLHEIYSKYQKQWYFVSKTLYEVNLIKSLYNRLVALIPKSCGLNRMLSYLESLAGSPELYRMQNEGNMILNALRQINYTLRIKGDTIEVLPNKSLKNYEQEIRNTFRRFRTENEKDYTYRLFDPDYRLNTLEEEIVKGIARLYPKQFEELENYYNSYQDFYPKELFIFYQELQFYLTYANYIKSIIESGLPFCLPVFDSSEKLNIIQGFDLNLIHNREEQPVILNNFIGRQGERIFIITGANQGGKTTFARMVGQIFYLASVGLPVPAEVAQIFFTDNILTHFEKEENINSGNGLFRDELVRIKRIVDQAKSDSLIILNEIFSSTTLKDAVELGKEIIRQLIKKDCVCLYVTFIDSLSKLDNTVSLVTQIDQNQKRTFKIIRSKADGRAYARSLAQSHGLTYEAIKELINN